MSAARVRAMGLAAAAVAVALGVVACDGDPAGPVCPLTLVAIPAVVVEPVDSASGARVEGAGGWAITGSHADSLRAHVSSVEGQALSLAAYGPAGTYAVVVRAAGYHDWAASGVRVREAECGVRTVTIRARMQPGSGQVP